MEAKIIRIGNSRGVRLPKGMLDEAGFGEDIRVFLEGNRIVIEPAEKHPRDGWMESFRKGGPADLDPEDMDWIEAPLDAPLEDDEREW